MRCCLDTMSDRECWSFRLEHQDEEDDEHEVDVDTYGIDELKSKKPTIAKLLNEGEVFKVCRHYAV
jgi:hypothetical protein